MAKSKTTKRFTTTSETATTLPDANGTPPLAKTVCRAICWPIWDARLDGQDDCDMRAFRQEVGIAMTDAARCRNYLVNSLAAADTIDETGGKLPKFAVDTKPIYRLAGERFPSLDCGSISALLQEVRAKYVKCRFSVWGRNAQALPTYRAPSPLPIRAAEVKIDSAEEGFLVRVSLGGGKAEGGKFNRRNFVLRIPTEGRDWAKNKAHLEALVSGGMKYGGAMIWMGARGDLMFKLAVHLPVRPESSFADRSLVVRTSGDDLIVLDRQEWHGSQIPLFHEDELRNRIASHTIWRRRMVEDIKHYGKPRRQTRNMRARLEARCRASNDYIADRLHKVAARLADHARIHRVGIVIYCDADRSFEGEHSFPWALLRQKIRDKLDTLGIAHKGLKDDVGSDNVSDPEGSKDEDLSCPKPTATKRLLRNTTKQARRLSKKAG